MTTLTLHTI